MNLTTAFLVLLGAAASIVMSAANPTVLYRTLRDYGMVLFALLCLGLAIWVVFPSSWFFPAALSVNGAACVAHGISLTRRFCMLSGFSFSVLGGFQLGLVLIAAIQLPG